MNTLRETAGSMIVTLTVLSPILLNALSVG